MPRRSQYQRRREEKLCVICGKNKVTDTIICQRCRDNKKGRQQALREERKKKGLCTACGKTKVRDAEECANCRKATYARVKAYRQRLREKKEVSKRARAPKTRRSDPSRAMKIAKKTRGARRRKAEKK